MDVNGERDLEVKGTGDDEASISPTIFISTVWMGMGKETLGWKRMGGRRVRLYFTNHFFPFFLTVWMWVEERNLEVGYEEKVLGYYFSNHFSFLQCVDTGGEMSCGCMWMGIRERGDKLFLQPFNLLYIWWWCGSVRNEGTEDLWVWVERFIFAGALFLCLQGVDVEINLASHATWNAPPLARSASWGCIANLHITSPK